MSGRPLPRGIDVTEADARDGRVALSHATSAAAVGSVFASDVPGDWLAGDHVIVVGRAALDAANGSARDALSSCGGWDALLGTRFGHAVLNVDEPQHALDRRRWAPRFTPAATVRAATTLRAIVERALGEWAQAGEIDVLAATRELAFAAVAETLAGFTDGSRVARTLSRLSDILAPNLPEETDAMRHVRVLPVRDRYEDLIRAHVEERRRASGVGEDLVAHLARLEPGLDDDVLAHHLNILLIAGHETTATAMAWLLHDALAPQWAVWLRAELDAGPAVAWDGAALDALPRLDHFVRESGRLHPPLVCAPRVALRDVTIDGVRIPAQAHVALAYGGTNLLASDHAAPLTFDPRRWADPRTPPPATFAGAHRLCMGFRFAALEAKLLLATALRRYDLAATDAPRLAHTGFWNARPTGSFRLAVRPRRL